MKKLALVLIAFVALLCGGNKAFALNCSSYPYTLTNGTLTTTALATNVTVQASNLVPTDSNGIAFSRSPAQVLRRTISRGTVDYTGENRDLGQTPL